MNKLKKIGIAAALVAPFAFGASAEAGAEQQPPVTTTDTIPTTTFMVPTTITSVDQLSVHDSADYSYDAETDERGRRNVIILGLGGSALFGAIMYGVWRMDEKRNNESHDASHNSHGVELLPQHKTPMGPEDDEAFWPPQSATES